MFIPGGFLKEYIYNAQMKYHLKFLEAFMESQNNYLVEYDADSLVHLFEAMYEQVKLQQEVRDRWFGHFISIIGSISAIATLCFGYFSKILAKKYLMMLLSCFFCFAGILGILFILLYIIKTLPYFYSLLFLFIE